MRPPKAKSATFTVRLSPAELLALHRESMREQLSASELIRRWIVRAGNEAAARTSDGVLRREAAASKREARRP